MVLLIWLYVWHFLHRAETERMLIDARHQQIQHRDHFLAVEALRDREEFNRVLKWVRLGTSLHGSMPIHSISHCEQADNVLKAGQLGYYYAWWTERPGQCRCQSWYFIYSRRARHSTLLWWIRHSGSPVKVTYVTTSPIIYSHSLDYLKHMIFSHWHMK